MFLLPISALLLQDRLLYRASITSTLSASVIGVMFFIWCFVYKRSNTWKRGMCSFNYDNARKLSYFQLQIFHNDTRWNKSDFLEYILRANFDSCFVGMKNVYFCRIFFSIHNGVLDINSVFFFSIDSTSKAAFRIWAKEVRQYGYILLRSSCISSIDFLSSSLSYSNKRRKGKLDHENSFLMSCKNIYTPDQVRIQIFGNNTCREKMLWTKTKKI